jgi:hypothetical protein
VAQTCNPSYLGGRVQEDQGSRSSQVKKFIRPPLLHPSNGRMQWHASVSPATQGNTNRIAVQAFKGVKWDPISKKTNTKRANGVAQVVQQVQGPEFNSQDHQKEKVKKSQGVEVMQSLWLLINHTAKCQPGTVVPHPQEAEAGGWLESRNSNSARQKSETLTHKNKNICPSMSPTNPFMTGMRLRLWQ